MEKKEYIKPAMEVMSIEVEAQMMTASQYTPPSFGGGEADGEGEALSNGRRGEWGNLWAETK